MDEPASALDPISTTRIEDLMHELKREYTIVIVTHNMQQAARVADMTAFFSVDVAEDGSGAPASSSSTTRRRRSSRRRPTSAPRTTSQDASVERCGSRSRRSSTSSSRRSQTEGELVLRSLRAAVEAVCSQDVELADEVIAFDDDIDERYLGDQRGSSSCSRDRRRSRPTSGSCSPPARQPPSRADGRPLRHDREADEADRGPADRRGAARRLPGDGRARGADDPRRARSLHAAGPRSAPSRCSSSTSSSTAPTAASSTHLLDRGHDARCGSGGCA